VIIRLKALELVDIAIMKNYKFERVASSSSSETVWRRSGFSEEDTKRQFSICNTTSVSWNH